MRTKVVKGNGGKWCVVRDAYGFGMPSITYYATHAEAVKKAHKRKLLSSGGDFERDHDGYQWESQDL